MKTTLIRAMGAGALALATLAAGPALAGNGSHDDHDNRSDRRWSHHDRGAQMVSVGVRPYYLVDQLEEGRLKRKLQSCENRPVKPTAFSIGHRGAAMQFPEHTRESYVAAARQGAGIVECDVTFTKDR